MYGYKCTCVWVYVHIYGTYINKWKAGDGNSGRFPWCWMWGAYGPRGGCDQCVSCLGPGHTIAACGDPASCMNYLILPAKSRRLHACCLKTKAALPTPAKQTKRPGAKLRLWLRLFICPPGADRSVEMDCCRGTTMSFGKQCNPLQCAVQRASVESLLSGLWSGLVCTTNKLRQSVGHYSTPYGCIACGCASLRVYGVVLSLDVSLAVTLSYASAQTEHAGLIAHYTAHRRRCRASVL